VDRVAMRAHAYNLGIKGDLYGVFACMVTGRPWESIMQGIAKKKPDAYEKELLLTGGALVIPDIAEILEKVDRQMLLVLKTNDLIRGIESTIKTENRMTAFWVMSKCCVKSVRNEEMSRTESYWRKFAIALRASWSVFKINFFYVCLGFKNGCGLSTMKQLLV
jgi:aarF domain-containing kinase